MVFWCPFGGHRVAQGVPFEALFLTFGVPFWVPHFGIVFWLILGCPREGKSCVFYIRVFKNRLSALLENVQKTTPKMSRFRYPFEAKISLLGVPENNTEIGTPKLLKWCQKWLPEGTHLASKIDPGRLSEATCVKRGSKHAFWLHVGSILSLFWYLFGNFLDNFLAVVISFPRCLFGMLRY